MNALFLFLLCVSLWSAAVRAQDATTAPPATDAATTLDGNATTAMLTTALEPNATTVAANDTAVTNATLATTAPMLFTSSSPRFTFNITQAENTSGVSVREMESEERERESERKKKKKSQTFFSLLGPNAKCGCLVSVRRRRSG